MRHSTAYAQIQSRRETSSLWIMVLLFALLVRSISFLKYGIFSSFSFFDFGKARQDEGGLSEL